MEIGEHDDLEQCLNSVLMMAMRCHNRISTRISEVELYISKVNIKEGITTAATYKGARPQPNFRAIQYNTITTQFHINCKLINTTRAVHHWA